jgi:non-specific serine/threonine protein kinase
VAQICYHLDGIPLAIELAAARVSYLSVEQILQHLDDRFRLLKGGSRTSLPRHQTLHALIDWSYSLLSPQEQQVLSRLAVFAGGFDIEAAEKVCAGEGIAEPDVLDYVIGLAKKSLVQAEEISDREMVAVRYRMLETIRQYGLEKLEIAGETYQTQLRHLNYFVALAQEAEIKLNSFEQITWLNRIEQEFDNIRAALSWAMANRLGEAALEIVASLLEFWVLKGYWVETRQWTEAALGAAGNAPTRLRAKGLEVAAWMAALLDEFETATVVAQQSLELYRSLGDRKGQAYAQCCLAFIAYGQGFVAYSKASFTKALALVDETLAVLKQENDLWYYAYTLSTKGTLYEGQGELEKAKSCYEEGLTLTREIGNKNDMAWFSYLLGRLLVHQLNFEPAIKLFTESARLYREVGNSWGVAASLGWSGVAELHLGNYEHSRILHENALALLKKVNIQESQAVVLRRLGVVSLFEENYARARELFRESLTLGLKFDRNHNLAVCLEGLGYLAWRDGNLEQAGQLIGAGEALLKTVCTNLSPEEPLLQEHFIKAAKTQLEEGGFLKALAEREDLPIEQAIALALQKDQTSEETL